MVRCHVVFFFCCRQSLDNLGGWLTFDRIISIIWCSDIEQQNNLVFLFLNFFLLLSLRELCDLHSTEVRGFCFFILVPKISSLISKLILSFIGALFGPAMTKWYQFLNRIKFPSPAKALIYRVSIHFPFNLY